MPWLQLLTETSRSNAPTIEEALLQVGAVSVTLQEHIPEGETEKPILEPAIGETPLWEKTRIIGLFDSAVETTQVDWLLQQHIDTDFQSRWEQLEDKDWEREWMQNYQPIQCAESLWICPSWLTPPDPTATNIMLDPGLAFGTGTHPTTFLCMQWLAKQNIKGKHVIDYGCGSGILGVTALRLGAEKVTGIDIDPQALLATQENVSRNGLDQSAFPVFLPKQLSQRQSSKQLPLTADIVIANILAAPLIQLAQTITDLLNIGGKLCLSGILAEQAEQVIAAYQTKIHFTPVTQKDQWVRLDGIRHD